MVIRGQNFQLEKNIGIGINVANISIGENYEKTYICFSISKVFNKRGMQNEKRMSIWNTSCD